MNAEPETKSAKHSSGASKVVYLPRLVVMLWVLFFPMCYVMLYSGPPAKLPAYIMFACFALVPLCCGSRGYRIFGALAMVLSICAAVQEHKDGVRYQAKRERLKQIMQAKTNDSTVTQSNATQRIP